MKTILTPLAMTLAFLALAACGADGEPETPEAEMAEPMSTASDEVPIGTGI